MALADIDHFVVLMLENRSFDSLLGKLYPSDETFEGLRGDEFNRDSAENKVLVWSAPGTDAVSMSIPTPDPGELFTDINTQIFGMPNPTPVEQKAPTMMGFVQNYLAQPDGPTARDVMHHYTPDQVPVLSTLAQNFAVCDHWHAAAPCQTWPNRFFVHTGTANGYENNSPPHFPYDMKTIFTALGDYVSWKIYFHDVPQSMTLSELWPKLDHFHFFEQFLADAKAGSLPNYSFIEPRYFADAALPSDQHPPHDVTLGEQLIAAVYNAVRAGPGWAKTMLIITYDEHGGNYDHVAPPAAPPPSSTITLPFNFDRYGIRVPAVLVSPYIPPRTKFRATGALPFDHTSIIATLRERFPTTPKLTARDAAAPTLSAVLSLPGPTNNGPLSVTALPYVASPADVAAARAAPLNGHQQALLQLAAHLPGTTAVGDFETFISSFLTHLRAGAGGTDVSAIQDVASAVNFIKGRLGSLFSSF